MTFDQAALVVIVGAALALFISDRVRYDLAALGALLAAALLAMRNTATRNTSGDQRRNTSSAVTHDAV